MSSILKRLKSVKSALRIGSSIGNGSVHGTDILNALKTACERRRKIFKNGTFAPDEYVVYLAEEDLADLKTFVKALKAELREEVLAYIQAKGYQLAIGDVRIAIKSRGKLIPGELAVESRFNFAGSHANAAKKSKVELILKTGSGEESTFALRQGRHTLGRGLEADIPLPADDYQASKLHCRIDVGPQEVVLNDLGSANGTFVNNRFVDGDAILDFGDRFRMGNTEIEVQF